MNKKILTAVLAVAVLLIVLFLAFAIDHRENNVSNPDGSMVSNTSGVTSEAPSADSSDTASEQESTSGESDPSEENSVSEESSSGGNNNNSVPNETSKNETSKEESKIPDTSKDNSEDTSDEASTEASEEVSEDVSEEESLPPVKEPDTSMTYAEYIELSAEEQQAHFESFASVDDFFAWYNAAKKEYDDEQSRVEVSGDIDIGDIIGGRK